MCSARCNKIHYLKLNPKKCHICGTIHFKYGETCSYECRVIKQKQTLEEGIRSGRTKPVGTVSKINKKFAKNIKKMFRVDPIFEKHSGKYSFDIGIPETNIAFELNPWVTHNSDRSFACRRKKCHVNNCTKHRQIATDYHYNKAVHAQKNDLRLVQLYDWDEATQFKEASNNLKHYGYDFEGILGKDTLELREVSLVEANFIQSSYARDDLNLYDVKCYELYSIWTNDDDPPEEFIVASAVFGKLMSDEGDDSSWEFIRYSVRGSNIIGGPEIMFNQFLKDVRPSSVVSYVNFDLHTGPMFLTSMGFEEKAHSGPTLVWFNDKTKTKVDTRTGVVMQGVPGVAGLHQLFKNDGKYDIKDDATMKENGFVRIFTSGWRVFEWNVKNGSVVKDDFGVHQVIVPNSLDGVATDLLYVL